MERARRELRIKRNRLILMDLEHENPRTLKLTVKSITYCVTEIDTKVIRSKERGERINKNCS